MKARQVSQGVIAKIATQDDHEIAIRHFKGNHQEVVILAHGFYNNKDAYLFKSMAENFSREWDVISFDFRGHGESEGLFSWTSCECLDLRAAVDYAKTQGYSRIGVIGFSLGAAVTLIEAGQNRDIHSVIAVSAPYNFWKINYRFWEKEMLSDLQLNLGPKGKGKGVRPGNPFMTKIRPIDVVHKISPTPVFFIHGRRDWLIHPLHSVKLMRKAKKPKKLLLVPETGHAEKIYDAKPDILMEACVEWFSDTLKGVRL